MFGSPRDDDDDLQSHHPEYEHVVPAGLQSLLIAEDVSKGRSATVGSPTAASASSSPKNASNGRQELMQSAIPSMFVDVPPLDEPNQPASKEGFLNKIGGNVKSWKTRYFRLCPGRLMYYKDGEDLTPSGRLGAILLPGASIAIFSSDVYPGHPYCFGLTPSDQDRQYIFDCDSVAHRMEWIAALTPSIRQRQRVVAESVREGYLTKLGGIHKNWKKRYVVLTKTSLKYYDTYLDTHNCLGTILLGAGFVVTQNDDDSFAALVPQADKAIMLSNPYSFSVRAAGADRTYVFCTTTRMDRDGWIRLLKEVKKGL